MTFDFDKCRDVLFRAIIDSLEASADAVRGLASDESCKLDGFEFGIFPWHQSVQLSFRTADERYSEYDGKQLDIRYSPAAWRHYDLIRHESLDNAGEFIGTVYPASGGKPGQEALHLILLAAADALLDERVALLLRGLGLNAKVRKEEVPWGGFEYMVLDEDQAFKANYCEIILANRVAKRLLGRVVV